MSSHKTRFPLGEDPAEPQSGIDYASFFPEENLLDALLSSDGEESDPEQEATPRAGVNSDAVASPGMSVAGRRMGRIQAMKLQATKPSTSHVSQEDSSQPIARRTRATRRLPVGDVELDDILFDIDNEELEEIENFGKVFDDDEEYQKFLSSLQYFEDKDKDKGGAGSCGAAGGGREGPEGEGVGDMEDEDDDDFIQELQEMIADEVDEVLGGQQGLFQADRDLTSEMPIEMISFLFRRRGRGSLHKRKPRSKMPKELRRSLRVENQRNQKRLYAARLATKRAQTSMNNMNTNIGCSNQDLAALAALMGVTTMESQIQTMGSDSVPLPSEFAPGMFDAIANAVRWKPPLPSTIRKAHEKLKMQEGSRGDGMAARGPERDPELMYHVQLLMFNSTQRQSLVMQIKSHVQMCFQALCLASIQNQDASLIEQLKRTLLSSMEGLFPVLRTIGHQDLKSWEEGIHTLVDMIESNQVKDSQDCVEANENQNQNQSNELTRHPVNYDTVRPGEVAAHIWSHLPYPVLRKVAKIRSCFDASWEPTCSSNRFVKPQKFTPAEDNLLAWGIRKHAYNWSKIREEFLPHMKEKQIFLRKKNSVSASGKQGNIIAEVVKSITMPLTDAEIQLLKQATAYYGKDTKGHYLHWDAICRENLPYRSPKVLSMLWAEWVKRQGRSGIQNRPVNR